MKVPEHMEITASLMAGYRFLDGSLLEVDAAGNYRLTTAQGKILEDTTISDAGIGVEANGMKPGAGGWEDYGEVMDDMAAFLMHDGEFTIYGGDSEDRIFGKITGLWAAAHHDELSMLANYREEGRL